MNGDQLFIALTDISSEVTQYYTNIIEETENVNFVEANNSLNYLDESTEKIYDSIKTDYEVYGYYTDVKNNKKIIEIADNTSVNELNQLLRISTFDNANIHSGNIDSSALSEDIEFVVGEKIIEESVIGGERVYRESGAGRTVGVCGTITLSSGTTYEGFVTAGHGLTISEDIYYDDSLFGKVSVLKYANNSSGDYALVKKTNDQETLTNKIYGEDADEERSITSYADDLAVGESVMKYGQASGFAEGEVVANDYTSTADSITIKGITKCEKISGSSVGGDSGGPYYYYDADSLNWSGYCFVGVHRSSSESYIYFTPYRLFKHRFTPYTSNP